MPTVQTPGRYVYLDFETYLDNTYTLKKMSVPEYVKDPRFEILLAVLAVEGERPQVIRGTEAEISNAIRHVVAPTDTVVAHNACFEGAVLEWRLGIKPAGYFCTMMGSRPYVAPFTGSMAAESVFEFVGGKPKLEMPSIKGKTRAQLAELDSSLETYCINDVEGARDTHRWLLERMPEDEQFMVGLHVEKFVRPRLELDVAAIDRMLEDLDDAKAKALLAVPDGATPVALRSNAKFAKLLEQRGVTVPTKISATTGRSTFAFAKKDEEFLKLKAHPDPVIRTLVEARLLYKSSIDASRAEAFRKIAAALGGLLPVPLLYYGAHTGRAAGWQGINMQNLPKKSGLRKALVAPLGYAIVTADLSQIEARITAVLAEQWDLVSQFLGGSTPYAAFASDIYQKPVSKHDPGTATEYFVGKTCILGLGFGMSADKLRLTLSGFGVEISAEECERIVSLYRRKYSKIPKLWRRMDSVLETAVSIGELNAFPMGPITIKQRMLVLPNGMPLHYPKLRKTGSGFQFEAFVAPDHPYWKPIWGGGLTENVVQALARLIISRAEVRLARMGLRAVLQVHDELVYVVPEDKVAAVKTALDMALSDPVPWLPGLPIACEVGTGKSYGQAK